MADDDTGNPTQLRTIGIAAGVAAVVCAALPWATVTTIFGTFSKNGTDGDGVITAIAGAFAGLIAWRARERSQLGALICGVIIAGIAAYDWYDLTQIAADIESEGAATASAGIGLYGTLVAGIALVAVSASRLKAAPAETVAELPPPTGPPVS